jgi:hypothetical protein
MSTTDDMLVIIRAGADKLKADLPGLPADAGAAERLAAVLGYLLKLDAPEASERAAGLRDSLKANAVLYGWLKDHEPVLLRRLKTLAV